MLDAISEKLCLLKHSKASSYSHIWQWKEHLQKNCIAENEILRRMFWNDPK